MQREGAIPQSVCSLANATSLETASLDEQQVGAARNERDASGTLDLLLHQAAPHQRERVAGIEQLPWT